jgi:hypothetical protein
MDNYLKMLNHCLMLRDLEDTYFCGSIYLSIKALKEIGSSLIYTGRRLPVGTQATAIAIVRVPTDNSRISYSCTKKY